MNRSLPLAAALIAAASLAPLAASAQDLSPTRQLRRVHLALTLTEPDVSRYEALLEAPDPDAFLAAEVDALLTSQAFHDQLVDWGHAYMPFPEFPKSNPVWRSSKSSHSDVCGEDTLHAGSIGIFGHQGDPAEICDDPDAPLGQVTPWWNPLVSVSVIGVAMNTSAAEGEGDCGRALVGLNWVKPSEQGCGCGPNMIYCHRMYPGDRFGTGYASTTRLDGNNFRANSQRRSAHDEPARLFAHVITQDRPFSDLVLGDYTVVDRGLYHMYARHGRQSGVHPERDQDASWFTEFSDDADWREVAFSRMHPHLLDDPDYAYDPTATTTPPLGIPAAGVLTSIGPNAAWPRPRVRAARWLESLACDEFTPPETPVAFEPFRRDPATEGVCAHCHVRLDAAAIHFKRTYDSAYLGGIGNWDIERLVSYDSNRVRFESTMLPDTVMTPVTEDQIAANPNARFYDFMPPGQRLLGLEGDGTIGPRGFAKILVASGAFDQCAVRRAYERFGGRTFDLGEDAAELARAVAAFVDSGRDMKALIRAIVLSEERKRGI